MRYLFYIVLLSSFSVSFSQSYLQTFSSWGGSVTNNGDNLQATLGEAIVFKTNTNFTQGFNQPNQTICLPVELTTDATSFNLCNNALDLVTSPEIGDI